MKKIFVLHLLVFVFTENFGQSERRMTKIEQLTGGYGKIIKLIDIDMGSFISEEGFSSVPYRINVREVRLEADTLRRFFFRITMEDKIRKISASVEYYDLLELIEIMSIFKKEAENDILLTKQKKISDYEKVIETKFVTVDGFEFGYYLANKKPKWFMTLENWGIDKTLYFNSSMSIETMLIGAKTIIENELKR